MAGFFVIVLLAAIVGLLKPYLSMKRWHFAMAALFAFIAIGVTAPKPPAADVDEAGAAADVGISPAPAGVQSEETPTNWTYSEEKDEMRGTTTKFARVASSNEVDLSFPYGVVSGYLDIRKRPEDGLNVIFSVDSGQILCHSFSDGYISVKFDDQPIRRFACSDASDGSSEYAFIRNEAAFVSSAKKASKMIIEAEFFQQGRQQFSFDISGLKWE